MLQGVVISNHYSQQGNKEQYIGQIRGALVHQAAPRGNLQKGTSCFKANLLCSCWSLAHTNYPKISAFLLTSRGIKSKRGIFLLQSNNTILFLFVLHLFPPNPLSPVLHYPNLILMFLGDLIVLSFFDILENRKDYCYTKAPARNFLSSLSSLNSPGLFFSSWPELFELLGRNPSDWAVAVV